MADDPRMAEIRQRLLRPASVEDVRGLLHALDDAAASPASTKSAEEGLRLAFEGLRQLTAAEPDRAVEILIHDLLGRCLVPDLENDTYFGPRLCHIFGEWVGDLPEEHRHRVRQEALPQAIAKLGGSGVRNAIRLISSIDYWDDDVLSALDRLARVRNDLAGDHALSARVALRSGLEPDVRRSYLEKLHARIPAGPNLHQILCSQCIGTAETAALVWSHWLSPPGIGDPEQVMFAMLARTALTEIAARERDRSCTTQVWHWLVELSRRPIDGKEDVFLLNSSLVNRLDLPEVVPELIRLAVRAESRLRHLYYHRVLECERPAHMPGWDAVPLAELEVARADAVAHTGMKGRFSTIELDQKQAAWDVLLCRGESSALPSFGDALAGEGGYVANRFLEVAACLGVNPLPQTLGPLLAGSLGDSTWDENERLAAQVGAIQAAHGARTREAFELLLGYRRVGKGVLLSVVAALAETACHLMEDGGAAPVEKLLLIAENSPQDDSRGAAAAAVADLLEKGALTAPQAVRAANLLPLAATDPYARRELLFAFATMPPADVPPVAIAYARQVLDSAVVDQDRDPHSAALALLARQPGARSDPRFLTRRLGLIEEGGSLVADPTTSGGVVPHVVGRYFAAEPERFARAVASLLQDGDANVIARLLPSVLEVGAKNPALVQAALVARLRWADGGRTAEPPVLHALARVAPDRLLRDGCSNVAAWLPQARADLADTLGEISGTLPEELATRRFELLARLAGDGIYAVRRSAYRAAAKCEPDRFVSLASSWAQWSQPGRQGSRRYAAECVGWLPPAVVEKRFAHLSWDQEPGVRDAYKRSLAEREDRLAADEFEAQVLKVCDAAGVVRNWRHGIGLSHVGDDSAIRRLTNRLADGVPPSVQFWLKRVRKAVERRWGKVTQKWPEPWFARPGHLETFAGVITGEDGKGIALAGTLWQLPAESPGGISSWGGWATTEGQDPGGGGNLMIPGRTPALVLVTSFTFPASEVVFLGNGPYPGPVPG
jgi:hypothetical protein